MNVDFDLWPKQLLALTTDAQLTVYGGAAGGGKSHLARIAAITAALQIPGLQVYLFRRHYNDLMLNHMNGPTGFRELLGDLIAAGIALIVGEEIRFRNNSKIHLCHCQYEHDVEKFRGAEMHYFIPEETTQFTEYQLRFLLSRVRIPDSLPIHPTERHKWPRVLFPTNPGGVGHAFLKANYIDNREPMKVWQQEAMEGGRTCIFIPARLDDNPSIDPEQYRAALMGLKRQELIDAMLEGKWDIPLGAFFPEADERKHLIAPFEIPRHWTKFRTFDWGSSSPFCVHWWAVADGMTPPYPRGSLVCYREWYGCNPSDVSKGIGLSNRQMVEGILERTLQTEIIDGTVTDSKPFQADGGITIAEEFANGGRYPCVPLTKGAVSKGSRIQGWQQFRSRLIGIDGQPYIYFFRTCPHTWREIIEVQADLHKPEDLDTSKNDHALDSVGLACKAKPWVKDEPKNTTPKFINEATLDTLLAQHLRIKKRQNGLRR